MRKSGKFGTELGACIEKAYYEKNRGRICFLCRKKFGFMLIYHFDEYLRENGKKLKDPDIELMQKIDSHEVCLDCFTNLENLEKFFINILENNCLAGLKPRALRLECRGEIEWYWS